MRGNNILKDINKKIYKYHGQQNKWSPQKCQILKVSDCSNKFDLCYYGQVNSLRLKSSVAS